jgi:signal transduction histidine kinase
MVRRFVRSYGELVFVFGLGALAQAELWIDEEWAADRYALAPVALAMTAILLLRTRAPLVTLVREVAALQVMAAVSTVESNDPMAMIIMALVAVYSAGAHARGRALLAAALVVLATVIVFAVQDGDSMNVSGFLFFGFFVAGPFLAGIVIRMRREREGLLVRERDERARLAVAEERTRIARELHDVVHAISVIVLQARGARHSLAEDPDDARRALDAIERTGSQALSEMRRLLAMLRDDDAATLAPQPSLDHLEVLAGEVRGAGLPVEVRVEESRASSRRGWTPPRTGSSTPPLRRGRERRRASQERV